MDHRVCSVPSIPCAGGSRPPAARSPGAAARSRGAPARSARRSPSGTSAPRPARSRATTWETSTGGRRGGDERAHGAGASAFGGDLVDLRHLGFLSALRISPFQRERWWRLPRRPLRNLCSCPSTARGACAPARPMPPTRRGASRSRVNQGRASSGSSGTGGSVISPTIRAARHEAPASKERQRRSGGTPNLVASFARSTWIRRSSVRPASPPPHPASATARRYRPTAPRRTPAPPCGPCWPASGRADAT